MQRSASFGFDLDKNLKDGSLKLIYLRPLDLSVDETVHEIVSAVKEIGCKRWSSTRWSASRWRWPPTSAPTFANRCTG